MHENYDPRYLGGILWFNERDFFEAHEVWESLWLDHVGPERSYIQGLIQAAVGLLHFTNGNMRGAGKLYRSSFDYMRKYPCPYLGLDHVRFWQEMERCFANLLRDPEQRWPLHEELIPIITLDPEPAAWPDRALFHEIDHDH